MTKISKYIYPLIITALFVRIILLLSQPAIIWPDSVSYLNWAKSIAEELNFSEHPVFRTPAYPSLLSPLFLLPPNTNVSTDILATQYFLGIVSTLFFFLTLDHIFSKRTAFLSALTFSLNPLELYYESVIQTEALFIPIFSILLWFTFKTIAHKSSVNFILLGFCAGLLSLTRPLAQLLLLIILLFILITSKNREPLLKKLALTVCSYCIFILPWLLINYSSYGFFALSKDFGLNLYHRTSDVDGLTITESKDPRLQHFAIKTKTSGKSTYLTVKHIFEKEGQTHNEVDRRMLEYSKELIVANPKTYLINSLKTFYKFFFKPATSIEFCNIDVIPFLCAPRPSPYFKDILPQTPRLEFPMLNFFIFFYFKIWKYSNFLLGLFSLSGIFFCLKIRTDQLSSRLFLISIILYFATIVSLLNSAEDRFTLPVIPLLLPFAIEALGHLLLGLISLGKIEKIEKL